MDKIENKCEADGVVRLGGFSATRIVCQLPIEDEPHNVHRYSGVLDIHSRHPDLTSSIIVGKMSFTAIWKDE